MLINLRNALMAGKRLPYDAEVEYLQSTGTQWIDTGILATQAFGCEISLEDVATPNYNCFIKNVTNNDFSIGSNSGNTQSSYLRIRGALTWANNIGANKTFIIKNGIITANRAQVGTYDQTLSLGTSANSVGLFANAVGDNPAQCKIFSCKLYDANGTLVRDFIPVRKGTTGELYDRVSGKFAERHGDFVLGQDVVPVEYIESHGTEYIDTGVSATGATNSEFQFKMPVAGFAFGARTAWNASAYSLNYGTGSYAFNYGNNGVVATLTTNIPYDANWHTAKIQTGGVLSLDEWTSTAGTYSFTTNGSLVLFGTRQGSSLNLTASGFKYCKIWDNSLPVRSFRPVRVGTEGAMMDVLTRRIYRNQGTGAFGYGADLPLDTLAN